MRIKLFTHTDLDGVGCHVVANAFFGKDKVDATYCDYKNVDEKVMRFFESKEYEKYERIYITDISVTKETADAIAASGSRTALIDHHPTAEWMNKEYAWALVQPTWRSGFKTSGTDLFLSELSVSIPIEDSVYAELLNFAEQVRRWDTWDWHNVYKEEFPKRLNNLMYLIGREKFLNRFSENLSLTLSETEELILSLEEDKIQKYINKVAHTLVETEIQGLPAGVVFAESYTSELGNVLAERNPHLAFIAIISLLGGSVSYRGVRDDLDLGGDLAPLYGGGGHPKAAGSRLGEEIKAQVIDSYFKKGA